MTTYLLTTEEWHSPLWCRREILPDGTISYSVINGAWDFVVQPDGNCYIPSIKSNIGRLYLRWEGQVPRGHNGDYNDAIKWILEQDGVLPS